MLSPRSGSITPSHHRSRPRESLEYQCGACRGRTRELFGGPMYLLGSGTDCGVLGVSPWNDFCPRQNPTPLIRAFVFSEPPTLGDSSNSSNRVMKYLKQGRFVLTASRALLGVVAQSVSPALEFVTLPHFRVLVILTSAGPLRMGSLAERMGANSSTFSRSTRPDGGGWMGRTRPEPR